MPAKLDPAALQPPEHILELDTSDERFQSLASRVLDGDYVPAARDAQALLDEGYFDIRLMAWLCFGLAIEAGPGGLGLGLQRLHEALDVHWQRLGPQRRREKQVARSVVWLCEALERQLKRIEQEDGPVYRRWADAAVADLQTARDGFEAVRERASEQLDNERVGLLARSLERWLDDLIAARPEDQGTGDEEEEEAQAEWPQDRARAADERDPLAAHPGRSAATRPEGGEPNLARRASSSDLTHDEFTDDDVEALFATSPDQLAGPAPAPPDAEPDPQAHAGTAEPFRVEGSDALLRLAQNIELFTRLAESGRPHHAAVVAADIEATIDAFDPRRFLPRLFAPYYRTMAEHIEELAEAQEERGGPHWSVLEQLYRVDPQAFGDGD